MVHFFNYYGLDVIHTPSNNKKVKSKLPTHMSNAGSFAKLGLAFLCIYNKLNRNITSNKTKKWAFTNVWAEISLSIFSIVGLNMVLFLWFLGNSAICLKYHPGSLCSQTKWKINHIIFSIHGVLQQNLTLLYCMDTEDRITKVVQTFNVIYLSCHIL